MSVESPVSFGDQLPVKSVLACARFIAGRDQNRSSSWIKCKGDSPLTVSRGKTQLLHVHMARALERVHARPAKLRTKSLQQTAQRMDFFAHGLVEVQELSFELIRNLNRPATCQIWLLVHIMSRAYYDRHNRKDAVRGLKKGKKLGQ